MSILVTGSLAIDRIMVFPDRFKNHILPDKLHILSVSFHVPEMREFFGGCAGNIAYGLKLLGADPLIMASAGRDFGAYADWLDRHGIRRDGIQIHDDAHTAQCFITTDLDDNQIVAFHPGAMERASELRVEERSDEISLAIVGPDDNAAMRKHAAALKQKGVPTVIDPGQQLINFDPDGLLTFLEGAHVFVANDYEWAVTLERTGIAEDELARRAGAIIVTRGAKGSTILQAGRRTEVPPGTGRARGRSHRLRRRVSRGTPVRARARSSARGRGAHRVADGIARGRGTRHAVGAHRRGRHPRALREGVRRAVPGPALSDAVDAVVVGAGIVGLAVAEALAQARALGRRRRAARGHRARDQQPQQPGDPRRPLLPGGLVEGAAVRGGARGAVCALCARRHPAPAPRQAGGGRRAQPRSRRSSVCVRSAPRTAHPDLALLDADGVRRRAPDVRAVAALDSPATGIVDAHALALSFAAGRRTPRRDARARARGDRDRARGVRPSRRGARSGRGPRVDPRRRRHQRGRARERRASPRSPASTSMRAACGCGPARATTSRSRRRRRCASSSSSIRCRAAAGLGVHVTLDLAGRVRFGPDATYVDRARLRRRSREGGRASPRRRGATCPRCATRGSRPTRPASARSSRDRARRSATS